MDCHGWNNFNTSNVTIQLPVPVTVTCISDFNTSNVTIQQGQ